MSEFKSDMFKLLENENFNIKVVREVSELVKEVTPLRLNFFLNVYELFYKKKTPPHIAFLALNSSLIQDGFKEILNEVSELKGNDLKMGLMSSIVESDLEFIKLIKEKLVENKMIYNGNEKTENYSIKSNGEIEKRDN